MRKADLQQQAVELIKQLSTENLQARVDYPDRSARQGGAGSNPRIGKRF